MSIGTNLLQKGLLCVSTWHLVSKLFPFKKLEIERGRLKQCTLIKGIFMRRKTQNLGESALSLYDFLKQNTEKAQGGHSRLYYESVHKLNEFSSPF